MAKVVEVFPARETLALNLFKYAPLSQYIFELQARWGGRAVRIWSGEHRGYWGPYARGYTDLANAGIYSFEEAVLNTAHCAPGKDIHYEYVPEADCGPWPTPWRPPPDSYMVYDAKGKWVCRCATASLAQRVAAAINNTALEEMT